MMNDADVRWVAAQHLQRYGPGAVDWLLEQAEVAYAQGDADSAETWREIAEAAVLILKTERT